MRTAERNIFTTIRTEGALLPADFLQHVAEGNREIEGLSPDSYHLVPGEKLNEAINRTWNRLLGAWTGFKDASEKLGASDLGTGLTRERWLLPLFQELGYGRLQTAKAFEIDGKSYPISHGWQGTPIHLVGCKIDLDRRTSGVVGAARTSPHGLVQEMLNRSEAHLWGFVSNGHRLRILRDNITLTRQAFVDFDLVAMFDGEVYADFVVLWLLCHQSRVEGERPELCWLEKWSQLAEKRGTRVLEYLRTGVENAINALGSGFLAHPANRGLRTKLSSATFNSQDYYRQLLRVVYRILFLFVAEDRGLLFEPKSSVAARELYSRFYSIARLRRLAERRAGTQHPDLWRGLTLVFEKLDTGCEELALPALGSFLWSREATTELIGCELANRDLLKALHSLAFTVDVRVRRVVDYKNLGSEELGSIYEALLEQHPQLNVDAATFTLSTAAGNERKTTGSYYTPTSLVNCLLDSALDPVLDEACKKPNPEQALLDLKVCDPASGSGHFLIAAAHRLAKRLGALRTGDEEPSPEATRTALRDVIGRCLYGVDLNPMAVELCKVSLWLEALEPGKPLSFLDHRIKVGNSLLGATPALIGKGIPDEAFTALEGDDKTFAAALKRANKAAREQSNMLLFSGETSWQALARVKDGVVRLEAIEDDTLEDIHAKEAEFEALMTGGDYQDQKFVADAWCAAFTVLKTREAGFRLTQEEFSVFLANRQACAEATRIRIKAEAEAHSFFHWHLQFPDVFEVTEKPAHSSFGRSGGFDVVLGNPPWDKLEFKEKEWFELRNPEITKAATAAKRKELIQALQHKDPGISGEYRLALRKTEIASVFVRKSGRFPLCGSGNTNSYALFAELFRALAAPFGRCGLVIPSGIASDDSTKAFICDVIQKRSLVGLYDFENKGIFPGVDSRFKFCLLTIGSGMHPIAEAAEFVSFAHEIEDLSSPDRRYRLSAEDIRTLNPNSATCPFFRSGRDAEITKYFYRRVPVLVREGETTSNPWRVKLSCEMIHMAHASHLFSSRDAMEKGGWRLEGNIFRRDENSMFPLYEAKMLHHFNHRWTSYKGEDFRASNLEIEDPNAYAMPRYWVPAEALSIPADVSWQRPWLFAYRNITNTTNERTVIAAIIPRIPVGHSALLIYPSVSDHRLAAPLAANLASFCLDYCARQKIGGTNLTQGYLQQLPVLPPQTYIGQVAWLGRDVKLRDWILPRVLELTYSASDIKGFAEDCGYEGPPFRWNDDRRFFLRCELDAVFFHLYLGSPQEWANQSAAFREIFQNPRAAVSYIMDTFPILKKRDEEEHDGHYRTKDTILEMYDEMAEAVRTGAQYRTRLNPPPADPSVAHSTESLPVLGVP
jgi:N-6 DNA Methylase